MRLQAAFDVLSRIVDRYESGGRTVRHVEATTGDGCDGLQVVLEVPVSLCGASDEADTLSLTPETASLTDRDGLAVEFSTDSPAPLCPDVEASVSATQQAVHVEDGTVILTVELTIDPGETESDTDDRVVDDATITCGQEASTPATAHVESTGDTSSVDSADDSTVDSEDRHDDDGDGDPLADLRDESVPPYEDVPYLEGLYESHDTFTEMSEAIVMDVSSETVRRYMIEADVHDPSSYDVVDESDDAGHTVESDAIGTDERDGTDAADVTDADRADEERTDTVEEVDVEHTPQTLATTVDSMDDISDEQIVTDGIGLPDGIRIEDVADAVVESMTVYEVTQKLGLDRQQTKDLLKQLNLIDLTMRRVDENPERVVSYDEVADRIRQCASSGA